jgi:transcriptional regulator with GAF, ATPase, and Fis domain
MKQILRYFGQNGATDFNLGNRLTLVGSSKECDIVLDDISISGAALKISPDVNGYRFEVLPEGKCRLNGEKIKKGRLKPGDRLEIGTHVFIGDMAEDVQVRLPGEGSDQFRETLALFTGSIGKERDLRKLLTRLMETLLGLLNGSDAFIFKLDENGKPEVFVSTGDGEAQERFSDTVVQAVLAGKKGIVVPNALQDPAFSSSRSVADLKLNSVVCTPVLVADTVSGIIYVGSRKAAISFSNHDLSTLVIFAAIAGMLINHVAYIGHQNRTILKLTSQGGEDGLIAESKAMQEVLSSIRALSESDIAVLLEGPTGCGKSLFAELIHKKSRRAGRPFLVVNCSSLHGELLESELFGHKKGSFTGAISDHEGLFNAARGGTLFLDEIGELDPSIQARLLRVLESNKVRPLGSTQECDVDTRVICATNKDFAEMVKKGGFRSDLYYRINQFSIKIPPLSQRDNDVVLLAYYYLEKFKAQYPTRDMVDFHPEMLRYIQNHDWPGNIRELSNTIHRAMLSCEGPLLTIPRMSPVQDPSFDFETATQAFHRELIARAIRKTNGNKESAAKLLGLSRSTFFRYCSTLNL